MKRKTKRNWFVHFLVVVLLIGPLSAIAVAESPRILVVGDSLSAGFGLAENEGWVALMQQDNPQWQIINASISGDTTTGGLRRLPKLIEQHSPTIVVIELGGNDGLRGQPLGLIEKNLRQMIQLVRQQSAVPLLLEMKIPPNYGPQYSGRFTQIYQKLATQMQVALVPFFLESVIAKAGMMQADGIHPTAAAQPSMMQQVLSAIKGLSIPVSAG